MASPSLPVELLSEEKFQCSICLNVFTNPVSTPCGHSFCMACIGGHWDNSDVCQCPLCKKRFHTRPEISTNTVIEQLAVQIKRRKLTIDDEYEAEPWDVACDVCIGKKLKALKSCLVCLTSYCEIHLEPHLRVTTLKRHRLVDPVDNLEDRICQKHERLLELFCRSDQTCVCVLCTETDHKTHDTVHIEEECIEKKTQLGKTETDVEQMIQDRLKKVEEIKQSVELSKGSTKREVEDSVQVFTALVSSIERSQAELIEVIEEKQRAAERRAEGLIKELEQEIAELKRRHTELEQLSHTEDYIHFLQSFPSLCDPPHTKDWSEVTVHSDLCVGTLRRAVAQVVGDIKTKLKMLTETELKFICQYKADVTLDSNTANSWLYLSEGSKRMKSSKTCQDAPDNPERFDTYPMVLGKQTFGSGRHYWEVQVGVRHDWDIGVAKETVTRKGPIKVNVQQGYFVLSMIRFEYKALTSPPTLLCLNPRPRRVGVYVDYEEGTVSFYNVEAKAHIYTFAGNTFTQKLCPYFYIHSNAKKSESLIICSVTDLLAL